MTFEKLLEDINNNKISLEDVYYEITRKDMMKTIKFYTMIPNMANGGISIDKFINENKLQELQAIVNILQILYSSDLDSPLTDEEYDTLQELLVDMGIPRLTGSIEINDNNKISHSYKNLRGTLDKFYYLYKDEYRTNKSRKYLHEWIKSAELRYEKKTGKKINLLDEKIMLTPKFDGTSVVLEWDGKNALWITRGDTSKNMASDVSHILKKFNSVYCNTTPCGQKFEVMCTEENLDNINRIYSDKPYKNSRQVVTSTLNSKDDFKSKYLYPIPLRIIYPDDDVETIHPLLVEKFPVEICTFRDDALIKAFADNNRYVEYMGMTLRTDGVVLTILDKDIQRILGRENDINKFEVAYKHTEEVTYAKVKNVEFYISEFGYITPVVVTNNVRLKGNTINHISISNKQRFDELDLHYGDTVKVSYDIIPYLSLDSSCRRDEYSKKIKFIDHCPKCGSELDLDRVQVQCMNPKCQSRIIGKIVNYCESLRIQNIGYNTILDLYSNGLLDHGIRSLYKLKNKKTRMELIEGFGSLKCNKIISEIESKRNLLDYELFGAIGIEGFSSKIFKIIFNSIRYEDFIKMCKEKKFNELEEYLTSIQGMGRIRSNVLVNYFRDDHNMKELKKLLEELNIRHENIQSKGIVVFSGLRPDNESYELLSNSGYDVFTTWTNKADYLIIPNKDFESSKVSKARNIGIPIISVDNQDLVNIIKMNIKGVSGE